MEAFKRVFLIVVDSFGIGAMDDAAAYGDEGANTFLHIDERMDPFRIPNLMRLGLGELAQPAHACRNAPLTGYRCALKERSVGKDTTTGHWEMMGLRTEKPFVMFTNTGFPQALIDELERRTGHEVIGNKAASGTEILTELAGQELASGSRKMIVYTSADSVLQICGHEKSMGLDELYRVCQIARDITMKPEWKVGRVIARPYLGDAESGFERTPNRKDLSVDPPRKTVLDLLKDNGKAVVAIGKIHDIFNGRGITRSVHSDSSVEGMEQTIAMADEPWEGLVFTNLVDFDAKWGHRRNPIGYGRELETFDGKLGELMDAMQETDLLIVTADHGNDPTHTGTDHTREKAPLLLWSPRFQSTGTLKTQSSFGTVGMTILANFGIEREPYMIGDSVLEALR